MRKWEWMRGEQVDGEEGKRKKSRRRNVQFPVMFSGPATENADLV